MLVLHILNNFIAEDANDANTRVTHTWLSLLTVGFSCENPSVPRNNTVQAKDGTYRYVTA